MNDSDNYDNGLYELTKIQPEEQQFYFNDDNYFDLNLDYKKSTTHDIFKEII